MILDYTKLGLIGLMLISVTFLSACDSEPKEKKPGQALVSVNGKEVTTLQLNDELSRAGIRTDQYETASKQLLESLIARQLIVDEATRNKLDRTPDVMRARERASAQVIAQAYLQGILGKIAKPSKEEINDYYHKHPDYFAKRKQFDLSIVRIATNDLNSELKAFLDAAKSLDEVVEWLEKNNVKYVRSLVIRSTADLPTEVVKVLLEMSKDQIFIANEREYSQLIVVNMIKDSPIAADIAAPQIEKFLINQKYKEATDAEINRLRALAEIKYLNATAPTSGVDEMKNHPSVIDSDVSDNLGITDSISEGALERGIKGLK